MQPPLAPSSGGNNEKDLVSEREIEVDGGSEKSRTRDAKKKGKKKKERKESTEKERI